MSIHFWRRAVFLSLLERCGPFLCSLRVRHCFLRLLLGNPLGVRGGTTIALRAIQQFFHFGVGNLCLAQLRDGLHFSSVELPIAPGALLAEKGGKLRRGVGGFVHAFQFLRLHFLPRRRLLSFCLLHPSCAGFSACSVAWLFRLVLLQDAS